MLKPALQKAARAACEKLAGDTGDGGPAILIGLPWGDGPFVYNAVALLDRGRIETVRYKNNLPNYGVFDEKRVFAPGPMPEPIDFRAMLRHCGLRTSALPKMKKLSKQRESSIAACVPWNTRSA